MNIPAPKSKVVLLPISSGACPSDPDSIAERIAAFRASDLHQFTRQDIGGHSDDPYCLDFPIDKVRQLLESPKCAGLRAYFVLEELPFDNKTKSAISLVLVSHDDVSNDIVTLEHSLFSENLIECCGKPPPGGSGKQPGTNVVNFMNV